MSKKIMYTMITAILAVIVILVTFFVVWGDKLKNGFYASQQPTITINNEQYRYKKVKTFLLAGVDKSGNIQDSGSYNNSYQSDFVCLLMVDMSSHSYQVVQLNRDMMVVNDVLDIFGNRTGQYRTEQLALAYTQGDGTKTSALNLRRTVSRLFYGLTIDYYLCMNMDAMKIINDSIGGVTLTLDADYTDIKPTYTQGSTVTLMGDDALEFIRVRYGVQDQTNVSRMQRQKLYMNAFIDTVMGSSVTDSVIEDIYSQLNTDQGDKVITDIGSTKTLKTMTNYLKTYQSNGVKQLEGTLDNTHDYVEFYLDKNAFDRYLIDTWLKKI